MALPHLTATATSGLPLVLSPFTPDDADRIYQLCSDPEIARWTTVPSPYPRGAAEQFVAETAPAWREVADATFSTGHPGSELVWGIRLAGPDPTPGLWGSIGLKRVGDHQVEIGWWLGADARGRGLMRASVAAVLAAAFDSYYPIQASAVWWYARPGNHDSALVAQRAGFRWIGLTSPPRLGPVWTAVLHPDDPRQPQPWPDHLP
jgi:RimJ/RimL family protein N-acetyltransferase